jgi:hypothetical protein
MNLAEVDEFIQKEGKRGKGKRGKMISKMKRKGGKK